jgi:hypothetical protein
MNLNGDYIGHAHTYDEEVDGEDEALLLDWKIHEFRHRV